MENCFVVGTQASVGQELEDVHNGLENKARVAAVVETPSLVGCDGTRNNLVTPQFHVKI